MTTGSRASSCWCVCSQAEYARQTRSRGLARSCLATTREDRAAPTMLTTAKVSSVGGASSPPLPTNDGLGRRAEARLNLLAGTSLTGPG